MQVELTAVYCRVEEGGYIAFTEEFQGANTQGATLEEARANLEDAVRLLIETHRLRLNEHLPPGPVIRERLVVTLDRSASPES